MDKDPHSLSGGYKRRLALAIQLVSISHLWKTGSACWLLYVHSYKHAYAYLCDKILLIFWLIICLLIFFLFTQIQTPDLLILDEPLAGLGMKKLWSISFYFFGLPFFPLYNISPSLGIWLWISWFFSHLCMLLEQ